MFKYFFIGFLFITTTTLNATNTISTVADDKKVEENIDYIANKILKENAKTTTTTTTTMEDEVSTNFFCKQFKSININNALKVFCITKNDTKINLYKKQKINENIEIIDVGTDFVFYKDLITNEIVYNYF